MGIKNSIIILINLITFVSLNAQNTDERYFEGEVHFKVSCISLDNRISQELLELETGDTMIGKVKRNKYLMVQNSKGPLGATKMIFLLEEGIGYIEYEKSDTITQFSIEDNPDKLLSKELNEDDEKVILGDTCKSMTFKYIPHQNYGVVEYVEAKYYYNPKYQLDKEMYSKHEMSFWNEFVKMGEGAISVRNEILTYPLYGTIYEVTEIFEKEIPEKEFELNKSKFIKEIESEN